MIRRRLPEALDSDKLEKLGRYEVRLGKLERTPTSLLKLQDLRSIEPA